MNRIEENRLVVLDTGDVMNSDVETFLANLLVRNKERYKEFYKHPLVICDILIIDRIKTYNKRWKSTIASHSVEK